MKKLKADTFLVVSHIQYAVFFVFHIAKSKLFSTIYCKNQFQIFPIVDYVVLSYHSFKLILRWNCFLLKLI